FTVLQTKYLNFGEEGLNQTRDDLLKLIPGVSALVWVSNLPISKELLDRAGPQLKIVATVSAGYNHCNPNELRARGVKLSNTPEVLSSTVAEIAVSLMLGAARRFTENLQQVRSGEWEIGFDKVLGQDLRGSTVGFIGFGGIGQATARRLAGFEVAKLVYSGHREKPEGKSLGAEFVSQDELLRQSDFIVLAVPLTNETRHMINSETLATMKRNAILVNVGRGVGLDVTTPEPLPKDHKLLTLPNISGLDVTTPEPLPKDHKLLTLPNISGLDMTTPEPLPKDHKLLTLPNISGLDVTTPERLPKDHKLLTLPNISGLDVTTPEPLPKDHKLLTLPNISGLDVTTPEPLPKDHKLLTLPNIFILPHIGSATVRTRSDMAVLAANNVVSALTGKPLLTPVHL
ncbi:Glyoxylate reductase/hydroxypyruvate reductase, partial [Operophtera brumata]